MSWTESSVANDPSARAARMASILGVASASSTPACRASCICCSSCCRPTCCLVCAWDKACSCWGRRLSSSEVSVWSVFTWAEVVRYSSRLASMSAAKVSTRRSQPSSLRGVPHKGHIASWSLAPLRRSFLAASSLPSLAARSSELCSCPVCTAMAFSRSLSPTKVFSWALMAGPWSCNFFWLS